MIIDTLENAEKYFSVHPLFKQAFQFVNSNNISAMEDGKSDIGEGLKCIISNATGKSKDDSLKKFECHDKNIDIQICIKGSETIGWKPRASCMIENGEYNAEKDVRFYSDQPDMFFQLSDRQFVIFFPEDVHAPMIGDGQIKKMVIKVKI